MMKLAIGSDLVVPAEPEKVEPTVAHEESWLFLSCASENEIVCQVTSETLFRHVFKNVVLTP